MNSFTLHEILKKNPTINGYSVTIEETTTEYLTAAQAKLLLDIRYGDRSFLCYDDNIAAASDTFKSVWNDYVARTSHNYGVIYRAFHEEYNPIENYDKYQEDITRIDETETNKDIPRVQRTTQTTDDTKRTVTTTDDTVITNTHGRKVLGDSNIELETEDTTTPTYTDGAKSVSEQEFTDGMKTVTSTNASDTVFDYTEHKHNTGEDGNVFTSRVHGNIGVTTGAQMIAGELEVRKNDLVDSILFDFVRHFTLYLGGDK